MKSVAVAGFHNTVSPSYDSKMFRSKIQKRQSCSSCLQHFMIVANIMFALVAATVITIFVYLHVTQVEFVQSVLGTNLVTIASCLVITAGALLFLLAIVGFFGACLDKVSVFAFYFGFLIPVFFTITAGILCALVFKTWLTEQVRYRMQDTLVHFYGVNLENPWNRKITENWDKAQTMWRCCSVDDQSWGIYQDSEWYITQHGTPGDVNNPKPFVPRSCCALDSDGHISDVNLRTCQTSTHGPPARKQGSQYAGHLNDALNYRGCYQAAEDFLINDVPSWFAILVGVGSAVAVLMLLGITLSVSLYVLRKRELDMEAAFVSYSRHMESVLF